MYIRTQESLRWALIFLRNAKFEFLDPFAHIVNDLLLYRHRRSHFVPNATCEDTGVKVESSALRSLRRIQDRASSLARFQQDVRRISLYHLKVLYVKSHAEPTVNQYYGGGRVWQRGAVAAEKLLQNDLTTIFEHQPIRSTAGIFRY